MPCSTFNIVSYSIGGITLLLVAFCLFKVFNLSRKVHSVSDFVNGEIFSTKFHQILTNYFSDETYTKLLLDPLTPYIKDVILKQCHSPEKESTVKDMAGMFFVDN